jgi:two-component system response regulator CpxR
MLTARGDDVDRIIGLEFGADDYLAKPFNPRELVARIKAILRRSHREAPESDQLKLGEIELRPRTHRASVGGDALRLTGTEFEILRCLLETPGEVVSKEQLSERALGRRLLPYDRSIDTHISNLRGKLEQAGNHKESIQNQRGVGYLLIPGE